MGPVPKGSGTGNSQCLVKETSAMEEVDFLPNSDVSGYGIGTSLTNPGKLYSAFPTTEQVGMCLPTKEVGAALAE